jgi:molybdenum cofactor cytidylyltransferase
MPTPFRSFAVVPAAGQSRRMGRDKLLLPWGETTVLESLLSAWRASNVDEVVVVTRADQPQVISICETSGASIVLPDPPPPEMKDSVRAALAYVRSHFAPTDRDVWLLAPADMPHLNSAMTNRVLAAHDPESPRIIAPIQAGRHGHPVLFPWPLAQEVDSLADHEGVNALLKRHSVREIDCDDNRIHRDLDTPEDYDRLRDR